MIRYVVKTSTGYVTSHIRGRKTKNIESARFFTTYARANSNKFIGPGAVIIPIEIEMTILED